MTPTLVAIYQTMSPYIWKISGDFGIRWYGFAYILSFVCAYFILTKLARTGRSVLPANRVLDVLLSLVMGVLIGGRFGYCLFYEPRLLSSFSSDFPFWGLFRLTQGGMSFHGGLAGVIVAAWYVAKIQKDPSTGRPAKMSLLALFDSLALATPVGLMLGRLANFVNGELLGRIVAAPGQPAPWWTVKFPHEITSGQELALSPEQEHKLQELIDSQTLPTDPNINVAADRLLHKILEGDHILAAKLEPLISARHPSQLYQAFAEGVFISLVVWIAFRFKPRIGVIGCLFMMSYAIARITTEFWRLPDSHLVHQHILGLSRGQLYSVLMFLVGAFFLVWVYTRPKTSTVIPQA